MRASNNGKRASADSRSDPETYFTRLPLLVLGIAWLALEKNDFVARGVAAKPALHSSSRLALVMRRRAARVA
jgi:hypothetical protein